MQTLEFKSDSVFASLSKFFKENIPIIYKQII